MNYAEYLEAHEAVRHSLPYACPHVPYETNKLPSVVDGCWMPYALMADEYLRSLANAINALIGYSHRLAAWDKVLIGAPVKDQHALVIEHIEPLGTVALLYPYAIRSRLIFATAHLCHQANRIKVEDWTDDFALDHEIYFTEADKHGKLWKRYARLKPLMERIANKSYTAATGDFRNAWNHRFSPRIQVGLSQSVLRYEDKATGSVSYSIGHRGPLLVGQIVAALEGELQKCCKAFNAFVALHAEHVGALFPPHMPPSESTADTRPFVVRVHGS